MHALLDLTLLSNSGESVIAGAAILLAQAALICGLLVQRRLRREAEERLRCREADLRGSYDRIRDIGGRLLTAQEAERSRIARELHDDISQQLALLQIELRHSGSTEEAVDRVDEVARAVRDLSHRLHPAKLQLLGLVSALRSLTWEQTRTGIAVTFAHDNVPSGLSPALTVCLFRVVQEALQNAVKYSRAAHVSVDVRRDGSALRLSVVDDGVGFDLATAWGKGLGLISIRERVEASGGTVAVWSRPGAGTRFDVSVPLDVEPTALTQSDEEVSAMNRAALVSVAASRFAARQAARELSIPSSAIFAES